MHLVLHLHRLDDADHLSGRDVLTFLDAHGEDGALHRTDDHVRAVSVARDCPALAPATRQFAITRLRA